MNSFNKKMDKVYFIFFILMVLSIPWIIITTTIKYGVTSQEFIVYLIVYHLMIIYLIHSLFILICSICSFEITHNLVKIKFLSKILAIEALEKVIFYDAGENMGGGCNIFVEIDGKFYNMHIKKDEYIRFKYFAKNKNIEFLGKDDYLAKQKSSIF